MSWAPWPSCVRRDDRVCCASDCQPRMARLDWSSKHESPDTQNRLPRYRRCRERARYARTGPSPGRCPSGVSDYGMRKGWSEWKGLQLSVQCIESVSVEWRVYCVPVSPEAHRSTGWPCRLRRGLTGCRPHFHQTPPRADREPFGLGC